VVSASYIRYSRKLDASAKCARIRTQCSGRPAHVPDYRGNGGVRAGACLLALKKLGSVPFAAILSEVSKQKTIKTEMDTAKACRWMIGDMVRKGLVGVKN
jgi:hypothetical protein